MAFTNEQIERYSRHIILKEVGVKGQKKLLNAKVLIIGAGGLGAPAAMYLAAAGVGTIGIADADEVDLSGTGKESLLFAGAETVRRQGRCDSDAPCRQQGKGVLLDQSFAVRHQCYQYRRCADTGDPPRKYDLCTQQ